MAKIRIYELARDLNMTNKLLLEKIRELNIPVKSHMSSLEDDAVARVKASIFGTKGEEIEETRIRPTIIRRRKKIIPKEPVLETQAPEFMAETPAVQTGEAEEAPVAEISAADAEATPVEPIDVPEVETEASTQPVSPAETDLPEPPEAEDVAPEKEAETAAGEPAAAPGAQVPDEQKKPVEESAPDQPQPSEDKSAAAKKPARVKPSKKKKKAKKDTPAKIIKMPEIPPPPKDKPAVAKGTVTKFPTPKKAPDQKQPLEEEQDGAAKKKKKWGKKVKEISPDKKFSKKKISFKRKEVVERSQLYSAGRRGRKGKRGAKAKGGAAHQKTQITTAKAIKRRIKVDDTIILSELAKRMGFKANELITKLMGLGVMATVNQTIDFETAVLVAAEFDYEVEKAAFEEETILKQEVDDPTLMIERPPVVTVMGHVDHGKTSLLDVIRQTRVTASEAGGITQHIGAYHVATDNGQIVFLDTPGHEAFTAMRSRGAQTTDLVVLVVAADDGVMPQTIEAINHSRAADVPIIVAVNKIDKANADPERVQRQLAELGLTPEDWGGETIYVQVSAKEKQGIDELLEMILLQAEVLELKANPDKLAVGSVVEAKLDSGRGPVVTLLVQEGTLRVGDAVVCGVHYGKIRSLINDQGDPTETAGPSMPMEVIGLSGVPEAGDELIVISDEKDAKQVSQYRIKKQRSLELAKTSRLSLDKLFEKMKEGEVKDLNIIIKADVHGSIEALRDSLVKLSNEEVNINVVHAAAGTISESDVSLAAVSDAIIIGFNVRPTPKVQAFANEENVDMRFYNVIYNVIREVKDAIAGMMASTFEEQLLGRAEVRQVFSVPKAGNIAGCYVTDGKIERGSLVRLLRDGIVIYTGKIASLRRFKDDVKDVQSGYECGIGIENYNDIKVEDAIESYFLKEVRPEID